jgi:hypothetical protein
VSNIIIYNSTGKLLRAILAPEYMLEDQLEEGEFGVIASANLNTDYVVSGSITTRPTQTTALSKTTITANGIDAITIASAPSGTFTATNTVTRETVTGPISGTDTFSTTIPGIYKIKIESWPYLDFETIITAVAP